MNLPAEYGFAEFMAVVELAMAKNENTAFKHLINPDLVNRIYQHVSIHYSPLDKKAFHKINKQLGDLEMKDRVKLISKTLKETLPNAYPEALKILVLATTVPSPKVKELEGFELWPLTEFVQRYGLDYFEPSLEALYTWTSKFTGDFAVRPFLIHHPKRTLLLLKTWGKDPNVHVRRLVSEGSRPRLPWGEQLKSFIEDPRPTLRLLEMLKYDEQLYVRKSVANHLNDVSKDHPDITIKTLQKWLKDAPVKHQDKIKWIAGHALRTLLKKGHPAALELLGYEKDLVLKVKNLRLKKDVIKVGEYLEFSFELISPKDAELMIDYIIHYKKANGLTSPKVFKLAKKSVAKQRLLKMERRHSFKIVTTRVLYDGAHHLELFINGIKYGKIKFQLKGATGDSGDFF